MQKIKIENIREGDFVFTFSAFPLGWLTRLITKGWAGHVGQAIDKYGNGQLYMSHMIGDLNPKSNDLRLDSFKMFDGWRNRILEVRRSAAYDNPVIRLQFRLRVLSQRIRYDYRELLSFVTGAPDRNSKKMICSGWCYQNGIADGVPWSEYLKRRHYAPSPEELRLEPSLLLVDFQ